MAAIVVGTNSYVTEAELTTYATDRGITITGATDVLLIKAMDYIESRRYKGIRYIETQALQFPRDYELDGDTLGEVPLSIENAQMIAALEIDSGEDLQSNVERAVKREKVSVIEMEYMDNAVATTQYRKVDDLLRPYLKSPIMAVRI